MCVTVARSVQRRFIINIVCMMRTHAYLEAILIVIAMSCVRFLCVCGGKHDSQIGMTVLMCAADHGHADCARLLIDIGADKEAKTTVRSSRGVC
jgi:hypothetical protein